MIDDTYRCRFTFADGRQCRQPICADDMGLCYYHQGKYQDRQNKLVAGERISRYLNSDVLTASDLNSALRQLFSATAKGHMKPKTAATLAYLAQLMLQTQRLAKEEYLEAYEEEWFEVVQQSITFNPEGKTPSKEEAPQQQAGNSTDTVSADSEPSPIDSEASSSDDGEPISPDQALAAKVM